MKTFLGLILALALTASGFCAPTVIMHRGRVFPAAGGGGGGGLAVFYDAQTRANGDGTSITHSLSGLAAGSDIVVTCANEHDNTVAADNFAVTSSPSLTWTKLADGQATGSGNCEIWRASFTAGGSITISVQQQNAGTTQDAMSTTAYYFTGEETTPGGTVPTPLANQGTPQITLTTTRDNSLILGVCSDWNAVTTATSYVSSAATTQTNLHSVSGNYVARHWYRTTTTAGSYTTGISAPSGQAASICAVEIRTP